MQELNFYYISIKYIRDLSKLDDNVMSISPQRGKQNRPFVGIIVLLNERQYCIPLTSPKDKFKNKKSQIDFIKIFDENIKEDNGTYKLIGVLNINNIIPVTKQVIQKVNLKVNKSDSQEEKRHKQLMQNQIKWCRKHSDVIINRANKVYDLVVNHPEKNRNLTKRSSKFKELELIADKYNKTDTED